MSLSYQQLAFRILEDISSQRTRDIFEARFGLKDGQRQTLEAIGQKYGITRERVRQIEEAAFFDLRKPAINNFLRPAFKAIDNFLNKEGKIVREERLFSSLTGLETPHPDRGAVFFIMSLGEPYQRFAGSDKFYPFWTNEPAVLEKAKNLVDQLTQDLEQEKKLLSLNNLLAWVEKFDAGGSKSFLLSCLDAARQIGQNNFGYFGLVRWPEINPRGARDKAYIVLKEQGRPLHFREVADCINQAKLGIILAQAQTVHNELIKDERFVLVGRGTYALKEWGYQPGRVKDIIGHVLKENGPLAKEEILTKVLESRLVKPNTILINLQNRRYFKRGQDGKYSIIK